MSRESWDGDAYQQRFDQLAAGGMDVHGEARFVLAYEPATVLDAGCGSGRVAVELARQGCEVVGVDVDESMLEAARSRSGEVQWMRSDLGDLDLGRTFDVVVLAGNVPLFTPKGTEAALVSGCAADVREDGRMITGFQLGRGYSLEDFDAHCRDAGLVLDARFATWDRDPMPGDDTYAVSVHHRPTWRNISHPSRPPSGRDGCKVFRTTRPRERGG